MFEEVSYDEGTRRLIDKALRSLVLASQDMEAAWGFGRTEEWEADLEEGVVTFSSPGLLVVAQVQVIGTFRPSNGSWMWGWANPTYPGRLTLHAERLRHFGHRHGIRRFTRPLIDCTREEAWEFTALAFYLAAEKGAFIGPAHDDLQVFLTLGEPMVEREDQS